MARSSKSDEAEPLNFETAMGQLELSIRKLEGNSLGLQASLDEYAKAVEYVQYCHQQLEGARRRIEQLRSVSASGKAVTQVWEDAPPEVDDAPTARTKRRGNATDE